MKKIMTFTSVLLIMTMLLSSCSIGNDKNDNSRSDKDDEEIEEEESDEEESEEEESEETNDPDETSANHSSQDQDGDYVVFGHYEQDGDAGNGAEPLEWEVVAEQDGRKLLLCRYIIDCQPYNTERTEVTWENCSLRAWLNDDFLNTAFNDSEKNMIVASSLSNPDNPHDGSSGGSDTTDKVFCLSVQELIDNYEYGEWREDILGGTCRALSANMTQYAIDQGAEQFDDRGYGMWWLRSTLGTKSFACAVLGGGGSGWSIGYYVDKEGVAVRPAIWVNN